MAKRFIFLGLLFVTSLIANQEAPPEESSSTEAESGKIIKLQPIPTPEENTEKDALAQVVPEQAPTPSPAVESQTPPPETAPVQTPTQVPVITGEKPPKTILINFTNVSITEFIRFISKISNKNFVFDEADLLFNVTIVSEEPTTLENIMSALLQELRIHGLTMFEQGNNIIIHRNPGVNAISRVAADTLPEEPSQATEIVTQVFRLNATDPEKAATLVRPLVSDKAIVEVFKETNNIIVTDIVTNIREIGKLLKSIDAPNNGFVIGQYVVRQGFIDSLVQLAQQIMRPIAKEQTLIFVPHHAASSIFIVSTPFLMERTLAILQYLDQTQGTTRIFDLKDLQFLPEIPATLPEIIPGAPTTTAPTVPGSPPVSIPPIQRFEDQWQLDSQGNWIFRPRGQAGVPSGEQPPEGYWYVDEQGNWHFKTGTPPPVAPGQRGVTAPEGQWKLDPQGIWVFQLAPGKSISPERLTRLPRGTSELPVGHIERTQFFIYKLQFRKGEQVQAALNRIGRGLSSTRSNNVDLVHTIDNIQWIEASNALIVTGTVESIEKIIELIDEIDVPLRQVFIEMLILDTTIGDSLEFGVDWGSRFGGGNTAGSQAFLSLASPLPAGLDTAGVGLVPDASGLALRPGFSQGIIGQTLTHGGLQFTSIGALVRALHGNSKVNIVLNPKILTEDNYPAEIFVGINIPYPTQAITNDEGNIITQNFEFRDVGTRLRVTPLISSDDMITLTIDEEVSNVIGTDVITGLTGEILSSQASGGGPSTKKSNTKTKVHLPNGFFLIMSGMVQDEDTVTRNQVPCLGGIPFLGAGFSNRLHRDSKRNLMIFIRPKIIDTEEEIDNITKHQQDIWNYKNYQKKSWKYENDEALEFFNLPGCEDCCEDCECIDY